MSKPIKIIYRGEEYIFIGRGSSLADGGSIITGAPADDDDEDEIAIYAELHSNGLIIRSGEIIGTIKDILFIDDESEGIN